MPKLSPVGRDAASACNTVAVNRDDVYKETDSISNSISSVSGGSEYESLAINTAAVSTTINDDTDVVTASLSATPSTGEQGGSITFGIPSVHFCKKPFQFTRLYTIFLRKVFFGINSILLFHHIKQCCVAADHCF